jgi:hypothetical protein
MKAYLLKGTKAIALAGWLAGIGLFSQSMVGCSSDDSTSGGSTTNSSSYTIDNVCETAIPKLCALRQSCCEKTLGFDQAKCETFEKANCEKNIAKAKAGTISFHPENIDTCFAQLSDQMKICTPTIEQNLETLTKNKACSTIFVGTKQTGEACDSSEQCQQPSDPASFAGCDSKTKTCQATVAVIAEGQACDVSAGKLCQVGWHCDTTKVCKKDLAPGATCDPKLNTSLECGYSFYCDTTTTKCVARKATDETCASSLECRSFACDAVKKTCGPLEPSPTIQECKGM